MPPRQFVQLAEETGLIGALTSHMLRTAAEDHALWRAAGLPTPYVSVNVAPSLLLRAEFRLAVEQAIADGLPADRLVLELTDTAVVSAHAAVQATLDTLRHLGVRLALDDFGTGHHVLNNLRRLPIDLIKIDRSVVAGARTSLRDAALMASYVDVGRRLNIDVVAVGVEETAEAERLRELGCPSAQGYLFGPPVSGADVTRRLAEDAAFFPGPGIPGPRGRTALA